MIDHSANFSKNDQKRILAILTTKAKVDPVTARDILKNLQSDCLPLSTHGSITNQTEIREDLRNLGDALRKASNAIESISHHTVSLLHDHCRSEGSAESQNDYDRHGVGTTIAELLRAAAITEQVTVTTLNALPHKGRGRNQNSPYLYLAYFVAANLDSKSIRVSVNDEGEYQEILAIVFRGVFSDVKTDTHLYFGKKAIEKLEASKKDQAASAASRMGK